MQLQETRPRTRTAPACTRARAVRLTTLSFIGCAPNDVRSKNECISPSRSSTPANAQCNLSLAQPRSDGRPAGSAPVPGYAAGTRQYRSRHCPAQTESRMHGPRRACRGWRKCKSYTTRQCGPADPWHLYPVSPSSRPPRAKGLDPRAVHAPLAAKILPAADRGVVGDRRQRQRDGRRALRVQRCQTGGFRAAGTTCHTTCQQGGLGKWCEWGESATVRGTLAVLPDE